MKPRRTQFWKDVFAHALSGAAGQCLQPAELLITRATAIADKSQAMLDEEAAQLAAARKLRGTVKA
jgi:hypothetical protein